MAAVTTSRRPSPLQRRVLIVLAALDAKRPGPVATRDIERVLEQGGDAPVYGPNLRASCRRMEAAGWLRTLRAPNLQLAVELTEAGRGIAEPLFQAEREAETARGFFFLVTFIININVQLFIKKSRQRTVGEIEYPARITFKDEFKQSQALYFQFHASLLFLQSITICQFRRY
ncbi:hypothetical protein [Klebsiella pneumoniae]|uniref:hypothetical protein n=1 Tax=Klebsiella pneumoniae TaxID=573 RepID=UPI003221DB40